MRRLPAILRRMPAVAAVAVAAAAVDAPAAVVGAPAADAAAAVRAIWISFSLADKRAMWSAGACMAPAVPKRGRFARPCRFSLLILDVMLGTSG